MEPGPRRVSDRAQDTTMGGAGDRVLQRTIENPACLWQISSHWSSFLTFSVDFGNQLKLGNKRKHINIFETKMGYYKTIKSC
jgi:hypothetical protein